MKQTEKNQDFTPTPGSDLYYALLFSGEQKDAIRALYAWRFQLEKVLGQVTDAGVAAIKFKWWREELDRLFNDQPRHPVSQQLHPFVKQHGLNKAFFEMLIDGVENQVESPWLNDAAQWQLATQNHWGCFSQLLAQVGAGDHSKAHLFAAEIGKGLQLIDTLSRLYDELDAGRCAIPKDLLNRFNLTPAALLNQGESGDAQALFEKISQDAKQILVKAWQGIEPKTRYQLRHLYLLTELGLRWLNLNQEEAYPFLTARVELTPIRKLFVAWKLHRNLKKQAKKA